MSKSAYQIPAGIAQKVDEIMAGRAGWSGPLGMSMTQGTPEGGGQGADAGQGGQGGNGQAAPGLLDEQAQHQSGQQDNGQQGGDQGQGQQGQGQGSGQGAGQGGDAPRDGMSRQEVESMLDRRINQVVDTLTRRLGGQGSGDQSGNGGGQGGGNSGQGGGQGGGQGSGQGQRDQGQQQGGGHGRGQQVQSHDQREARMVYREYVGDQVTFLGTVERDHAARLGNAVMFERLRDGADPEAAGRAAADEVAREIKALRAHYETQTVAALRRRGLLPADASSAGLPVGTGSTPPSAASGFQAGASKATELLGDRMPKQTGNQQR